MNTNLLTKMLNCCIFWNIRCKCIFFHSEILIQCKSQVNMWIILELIKMAFSGSLEERKMILVCFPFFSTFSFQGKIIYQSNCNLCALLCIFLCYFIKQAWVTCCSLKMWVWVNYKVEIGNAKNTKWGVICYTEDCCTHANNLWFIAGGSFSQRKSLWKFELLSVIIGWLGLIQQFSPYLCLQWHTGVWARSTVWRQNVSSHFYLILTSTRRMSAGMDQFKTLFFIQFCHSLSSQLLSKTRLKYVEFTLW